MQVLGDGTRVHPGRRQGNDLALARSQTVECDGSDATGRIVVRGDLEARLTADRVAEQIDEILNRDTAALLRIGPVVPLTPGDHLIQAPTRVLREHHDRQPAVNATQGETKLVAVDLHRAERQVDEGRVVARGLDRGYRLARRRHSIDARHSRVSAQLRGQQVAQSRVILDVENADWFEGPVHA
jgi:hypothetical protein